MEQGFDSAAHCRPEICRRTEEVIALWYALYRKHKTANYIEVLS